MLAARLPAVSAGAAGSRWTLPVGTGNIGIARLHPTDSRHHGDGCFGSIAAATHRYTSVRFTPASDPSAMRAAEECPSPPLTSKVAFKSKPDDSNAAHSDRFMSIVKGEAAVTQK
jgi:hypothetical protein